MGTESRGQHYVPQVYLRAFAEDGKVRVYRKPEQGQQPTSFETSTKNIAKRRDVYSVKTDQGRDRYIDKNFEKVERLLDAVRGPVVEGHLLGEAQWEALKYLVAIQDSRSPAVIDSFTESTTQMLDAIRGLYRKNRPDMTDDDIEKRIREQFPSQKLSGPLATDPRNLALTATNSAVPEFARHLTAFHGTIITSGAQDFVTSNRPVVWFDPNAYPPTFLGFNRQSPTIEVTYPLTRRKCLFLCLFPAPIMEYASANEVGVSIINNRTACAATEVYAYPTEVEEERQRQLKDLAGEAFRFPLVATLLDLETERSE